MSNADVLIRDESACQYCGRTYSIHVHHIIYKSMCHNTSILEADRNKITLCVEHHEEGRENVHNGKIVVIYLEEAPDFPIAVLRKKLNDIKVLHGLVKDSTKLIYETNIKGVSQLYE